MAISIYADEPTHLEWDAATREFSEPKTPPAGPIFTIRAHDYWWTQQRVQPASEDKEGNLKDIRDTVTACLLAIDGSAESAERFKTNPSAKALIPLYNAIINHTLGN